MIGGKPNLKKHDGKKQEIVESINNRNCVKERKIKPKEMTNVARNKATTIGNTWRRKKIKRQFKEKQK